MVKSACPWLSPTPNIRSPLSQFGPLLGSRRKGSVRVESVPSLSRNSDPGPEGRACPRACYVKGLSMRACPGVIPCPLGLG